MRWGKALGRKINDVIALFPKGAGDCPEFPGILSHRDQGRFAIGFHQQKAKNDRDLVEILARKSVESAPTDAEIADEFLSEPLPE
jgi:hypothetical protein